MDPSSAAMLLDPKAFKKQQKPTNGRASAGASSQRPSASPRPTGAPPPGTTFDPQQLLSPREFNNRAKRPRTTGPGAGSAPSIAPQFMKAGGSSGEFTSGFREENAGSEESSGVNTPTSGSETPGIVSGHGSLIENMYGVEERGAQPQKRVKVEKGRNGVMTGDSKSAFSTPGGASDMGEYMKESSGTNTPANEMGQMIDLTLDDEQGDGGKNGDEDDDMVIVGSKDLGAEEVCYGRLDGALVLAHRVPRPSKSLFGDPTSDWPSIRCTLSRQRSRDTRIEVLDSSAQPFGIIDQRVAAGLAPLLDSVAIKMRTQARLDVRKKKPDEWPGQPCSDVYRISINLYGPRKLADGIGRHLGQKNVWLGPPNSVEAGFSTYNPHAEKRLIEAANNQKKFSVTSETRTIEEINSAVTKMFDHLASAENLPEMEPPDTIKTPMLPHQKQALWFMMDKEKPRRFGPKEKENTSLWRIEDKPNGQKLYRDIISGITSVEEPPQALGGLLADMMGLGKTLSILSLVLSTLPESRAWAENGPAKEAVMNNLPTRNIKTTLLVSPLSAVGNWITQIKEHLKDSALSWYLFHGPARTQDPEELAQYDLVITTYSTILSEISGKSSKRSASPLSQVNMFRIVLDEAHAIREQNAAQSQAIFSLNADRRWSVTGTPIQNRLEDLASVTKFLRLYPYSEKSKFMAYIVSPFKNESPSAIKSLRVLVDSFTLRRVKDKIDLPPRQDHVITLTFSEQEKMLHEFFRKESRVMMNVIAGEKRDKMRPKMYHLVLKAMMILRQISAHGKELLDQKDRERFRGLSANDAIDLEEESDTPSANIAEQKAYEMLSLMEESSANVCAQCGNAITVIPPEDNISDKNAAIAAMLPCYDILCADCFRPAQRFLDEKAGKLVQLRCPVCEGVIPASYSLLTSAGYENYQSSKQTTEQSRKQVKVFGQYEGPHTKTKALLAHLLNTIDENKRLKHKPPIKSVIFSSWTSHLDLIELALEDNGIYSYTRLDGTMTLRQRNASLDSFRDDNNVTILLATLGAGGVGLNLTAGSRVYVMEPQYNPAAVAQAVDRVHRLGQKREVIIVHFIMKDSIEEKIEELAKKKQKLADMSLNQPKMDKREKAQERMREYRNLFT